MTAAFAPPMTTQTVDLATGVHLPYVEQGDPDGVPVLFLHGYSDSWRSFEPVLPFLPSSLRALVLTQRGHGDAERPATGYGQRDFAGDAVAFLDALGIGSAVVVGMSMGSTVAQHVALEFPERVRGLMLIATFARYRGNPGVADLFDTAVAALEDPIDPGFVREFQESTIAQPVDPALLEMVIGESLKMPARVWKAALAGCLAADWTARLPEIQAPTLVAWGDQDVFSPRADQDLLATAIAGARLEIYAGFGHALHWEDPARVARDLVGFVAGLTT